MKLRINFTHRQLMDKKRKEQKAILENWEREFDDFVSEFGSPYFEDLRPELHYSVRRLLEAKDAEWKCRLNQLAEECTTDYGTVDFEMFAEKIFTILEEK